MKECIYCGLWGNCNCSNYICTCNYNYKELCPMYTPVENDE